MGRPQSLMISRDPTGSAELYVVQELAGFRRLSPSNVFRHQAFLRRMTDSVNPHDLAVDPKEDAVNVPPVPEKIFAKLMLLQFRIIDLRPHLRRRFQLGEPLEQCIAPPLG